MQQSNLNLARKWRSKNFEQIIGQDLVVRILKNSLYINQLFPVYLFSGQRGCGKTSTARIFAAALNCENLASFQSNPKIKIPCSECVSCSAMASNKHPDFVEMDAASHTGVDNIRNIIEASTLMPILGKKKIYLIDEAHMLSKSAFNAFLKILEEPPATVIFILATTDVEKIIETVKSRCFQLIFGPISSDYLVSHLAEICKNENIDFETEGLELIVNESEGSARDAINLMEQVRFSCAKITRANVQGVLGHPDDSKVLEILNIILKSKDSGKLLIYLENINFYNLSAIFIWNQLLKLVRVSLYLKYDIHLKSNFNIPELEEILDAVDSNCLIKILEIFCENEQMFIKTSNKNLFLELILLRIINLSNELNAISRPINFSNKEKNINSKIEEKKSPIVTEPIKEKEEVKELSLWDNFLNKISQLNEPLVLSVFKQSKFVNVSAELNKVEISFYKKQSFLISLLEDSKKLWQPIIKEVFDVNNLEHQIIENLENKEVEVVKKIEKKNESFVVNKPASNVLSNIKQKVDVSDKSVWKLANVLLEAFPGELIEVKENE